MDANAVDLPLSSKLFLCVFLVFGKSHTGITRVREKQYICAFSLGWSTISLKNSKQSFGG